MDRSILAAIVQSQHSWWQARYSDGRVLSEWDTLTGTEKRPVGDGRTSHWEDVPKDHMIGLRLLCPNGMVGELEATEGHRFFQLKSGGLVVGGPHYIEAHIIGVLTDNKGNCFCRAWEYGPKRLVEFRDNVFNMKYCHIGRLSLDVQQLKV